MKKRSRPQTEPLVLSYRFPPQVLRQGLRAAVALQRVFPQALEHHIFQVERNQGVGMP